MGLSFTVRIPSRVSADTDTDIYLLRLTESTWAMTSPAFVISTEYALIPSKLEIFKDSEYLRQIFGLIIYIAKGSMRNYSTYRKIYESNLRRTSRNSDFYGEMIIEPDPNIDGLEHKLTFYKNNYLALDQPYMYGQLQGDQYEYLHDGQLMAITPWTNGVKNGIESRWYFTLDSIGEIIYTDTPLVVYYWLEGQGVTREEYEKTISGTIYQNTNLPTEMTKVIGGYSS